MPAPTLAKPNTIGDAGYLYYAPVGTTLPTNTVAGSIFTDTFGTAPWTWLGMTAGGSTWHYNLTTANIEAAEQFDPVGIRTTGRTSSVDFVLMSNTASNLAIALNGATKTITGSTGTTLTKVTPPNPGAEVRFMIGWEATDFTVRKIAYQCINSGDIAEAYNKAPATANIPFTLQLEISSTYLTPYETFYAGVNRG